MLNVPITSDDPRQLPVLQLCRLATVSEWRLHDMRLPQWRLLCPLDAGARIHWQHRTHALTPGHVYLVAPHTPCSSDSRGSFRLAYAHLHWPRAGYDPLPGLYEHRLSTALRGDLDACADGVVPLGPLLLHCAIAALRDLDERAFLTVPQYSAAVAAALERIHADPGGCPDNETLAADCHVSSATLNRRFAIELGISVHRYVTRQRLVLARTLLLESDESIDGIAARCGFVDRHHFSRAFKRAWDIPPATLRRRSRSEI